MKIECIKDVVVSGRTVYVQGNEYDCVVKRDEAGNLVSHEITGECGLGVFLAGDPSLEQYFNVEEEKPVANAYHNDDYTDIERMEDQKTQSGMGKILSFFRKNR
jgi:hypothetical protein